MDKPKNQDLLPTLYHLCGLQMTRNALRFSRDAVVRRISTTAQLVASGSKQFSPLHEAYRLATGKDTDAIPDFRTLRMYVVDGVFARVEEIRDDGPLIVLLPKSAQAMYLARIFAIIIRQMFVEYDRPELAEKPFVAVLVTPGKIDAQHTRILPVDISDVEPESLASTYGAFKTAIATNDESDFDLEIELQGMRTRTHAARERIKRRMQQMGVHVLKGSKASVFLRKSPKKVRVNIKLLRNKFPDAYRECVTNGKASEYITIKLRKDAK